MNQSSSINDCTVRSLPKIIDPRGNLTFIEGNHHIPFDIKRVFYLYDIQAEKERGGHAHFKLHQFIICLTGSIEVKVDDGVCQEKLILKKPWEGIYIVPMIWVSLSYFKAGSVCLVLASDIYKEDDYIRDYGCYLKHVGAI